jgi:MFS family permease
MTTRTRAWLVTFMVFLFMVINFADKAVLGLSSGSIIDELHLSHAQFGELGSSFFLLFALSGVITGFVANRVSVKLILLVMALLWSAMVLPLVVTVGFGFLLGTRVILGAAEGPAFPVAMHAVHKWFPDSSRAVPTSAVACGAAFGTGVVAPGIAWIISHHSWHAAFGTLGVVGIVWAAAWLFVGQNGTVDVDEESATGTDDRLPTTRLLLCRTAIGIYLAGFAAYWILSLDIVWLANYLTDGLGLSLGRAALIIALPSVMQIILAPGLALLSQRWTRRGVPTRVSRGILGALCVVVAGAAMALMPGVAMGPFKIFLIGLAFSIGSVIFTLGTTVVGELAPGAQRGGALGLTNSLHTLAGLLAPTVLGKTVDAAATPAAGFKTGFVWTGLVVVLVGLVAAALINPRRDRELLREHSVTQRRAQHPAHAEVM